MKKRDQQPCFTDSPGCSLGRQQIFSVKIEEQPELKTRTLKESNIDGRATVEIFYKNGVKTRRILCML